MPKKSKPAKRRPQGARPQVGGRGQAPLYKQKPPKDVVSALRAEIEPQARHYNNDFVQATPIVTSHFELREDGTVAAVCDRRITGEERRSQSVATIPNLIFSSDTPFVRLCHGNCLELLDTIAAKYPEGRFDAIFADPPYFLSNGGITCHFGES